MSLYSKAISFLLIILGFVAQGQASKPNIVWITIEDTSPDFIGCYGNKQVRTPNIDALAAEGVRFTNAFSTNTVCSPSRHTIITGVRTAQDGCGNHRSKFKIPTYIKGLGYYLKNNGYFTSNNSKTDYNIADSKSFVKSNWTEQGSKADFNKISDKNQAFFSVFNFEKSHQSRTVGNSVDFYNKEILATLSPDEIISPDNLEVPPFYKNNANNRKNIARLYNCLKATDKEVGRIVKMIKDHGDWENTIVFFFSDHGQGMPRFKTNSSRLGSQIPLVVRFPEKYQHLINAQKGGIFEDVVTFEDLAPTLINIATTISKPQYMKGKAFLGEKIEKTKKSENVFWGTRDGTDEVIDLGRNIIKGDYSYTRVYYPHLPVLQQQSYYNRSDMLKEMRADLKNNELDSLQASIFKPRSVEYLFNRKTDAWETKNLATDIKYKKILAQLRDLNQQKILDYNDTGFMPEYIIANIDKKDTLLNWKKNNYKVKKYLKIAEMVGKGKAYLNKQLKLAANQDSLVRYWAVVGLRNQSAKDLKKESIDALYKNEKSLFVKLEIAEILRYQFGDFKAWEWLTDFVINNKNEYLERQAMMKLANDENLPVSTIEKLKLEKNNINKKFKNTDMAYPISAAIGTVLKLNVEDEAN